MPIIEVITAEFLDEPTTEEFMKFVKSEEWWRKQFDDGEQRQPHTKPTWCKVGLEGLAAQGIEEHDVAERWEADKDAHWYLHLYVRFCLIEWANTVAIDAAMGKAHDPSNESIGDVHDFVAAWSRSLNWV